MPTDKSELRPEYVDALPASESDATLKAQLAEMEHRARTAEQALAQAQQVTPAQPQAPSLADIMPDQYVNPNKFVVLSSRLGRKMEALPKINPDDATEQTRYHVPDAFERGEVIDISDIEAEAKAPGYANNLERLLSLGAIGRLDHPEARGAVDMLEQRRGHEASVARQRVAAV